MSDKESTKTLANRPPTDREIAAFFESVSAEERDPEVIQAEIIARIMKSESFDAALAQASFGTEHARDHLNEWLTIRGVAWQDSRFEGRISKYAVIDAVTADGEPMKLTCGAGNVMAVLFAAEWYEAFPFIARIMPSPRPTQSGYIPLTLEAERS